MSRRRLTSKDGRQMSHVNGLNPHSVPGARQTDSLKNGSSHGTRYIFYAREYRHMKRDVERIALEKNSLLGRLGSPSRVCERLLCSLCETPSEHNVYSRNQHKYGVHSQQRGVHR